MIKEIREELDQLGERIYRQFNQKTGFPGTTMSLVFVSGASKLAQGIAKQDWRAYLKEKKLWKKLMIKY